MTVEELIREISSSPSYNYVILTSKDHSKIYDYDVYVDKDVVFIEADEIKVDDIIKENT